MVAAIRQPGWYRGAIGLVLGAAFGFGLVVALRAISGLDVFQTEMTERRSELDSVVAVLDGHLRLAVRAEVVRLLGRGLGHVLRGPEVEPGVLRVDARLPLAQLQAQASAWLNKEAFA